jgi:type IV pilus assembly protein PilV
MIEALVALVVLSVGLLGMAALFITSLHSGSGAISRMQAVNLATDLADRIRANDRQHVAAYSTSPSSAPDCITAACSPDDLAAFDRSEWDSQITKLLPGSPTGTVTVNPATYTPGTPTTVTITVSWLEPGSSTPLSYSLVLQV